MNDTFSIYSFEEFINKLCLKTKIDIENPVVDLFPIDYSEVIFPRILLDGKKHKIYTGMIHALVHLNPGRESDYLFSYMNYINNSYANPKMEFRELARLFRFVYNGIINDEGYQYGKTRVKYIHFNPKSGLNGNDKKIIASKLNGQRRTNESIEKIIQAKELLVSLGEKVTLKSIAQISGRSLRTVNRLYRKEATDINAALEIINRISPNKINMIEPNERFSQFGILTPLEEFRHPECPLWVPHSPTYYYPGAEML